MTTIVEFKSCCKCLSSSVDSLSEDITTIARLTIKSPEFHSPSSQYPTLPRDFYTSCKRVGMEPPHRYDTFSTELLCGVLETLNLTWMGSVKQTLGRLSQAGQSEESWMRAKGAIKTQKLEWATWVWFPFTPSTSHATDCIHVYNIPHIGTKTCVWDVLDKMSECMLQTPNK